jgi:hypothetical protein
VGLGITSGMAVDLAYISLVGYDESDGGGDKIGPVVDRLRLNKDKCRHVWGKLYLAYF